MSNEASDLHTVVGEMRGELRQHMSQEEKTTSVIFSKLDKLEERAREAEQRTLKNSLIIGAAAALGGSIFVSWVRQHLGIP